MATVLVPLTQGKFATIDEEDAPRVLAFSWYALRAGGRRFYAARRYLDSEGKAHTQFLHRLLLDAPPGMLVDHRDRDGLNCTRANIRLATTAQNSYNKGVPARSLSGFKGVGPDRFRPGFWVANIMKRNKRYPLGSFPTAEEAARAYDNAARELFGDFAYLNFPEG